MWGSLLIAVVLSIALQVCIVAALRLIRSAGNVYFTIILVSVLTAPLAWVADRVCPGVPPLTLAGRLYLTVLHLTLGGFFFHFMTLPDRSVTLRILVELLLAPHGALSFRDLRSRYSVTTMIESRLQQLSAGQFLTIAPDGRITLIGKGLWFGRFVTTGRRLFGIASAN